MLGSGQQTNWQLWLELEFPPNDAATFLANTVYNMGHTHLPSAMQFSDKANKEVPISVGTYGVKGHTYTGAS